jgi:hypothetical protein
MLVFLSFLLGLVISVAAITLVETILWWHHWRSNQEEQTSYQTQDKLMIFLSGTSDYTRRSLYDEQVSLLKDLREQLGDYEPCYLQFPFQGKTAEWCRKFAYWPTTKGKYILPLPVIALRNFWQAVFLSSAESSYSRDLAQRLAELVSRHSCRELLLVCGSSGATIAVNSAQLIKQRTGCQIYVASFGGVLLHQEGLSWIDSYVAIDSTQDKFQKHLNRLRCFRAGSNSTQESLARPTTIDGPGHMDYLAPEYRQLIVRALAKAVPGQFELTS